jgi:cytochrome c-type protein NapB
MKKLIISTLAAVAILTGCNQTNTTKNEAASKVVTVTGVRKSNVNKGSENLPVVTYTNQAPIPGQVKPFKKSFVTAPPMIPHSVEGMVPITIKNNMCLNCHMPQNAKSISGCTPLGAS